MKRTEGTEPSLGILIKLIVFQVLWAIDFWHHCELQVQAAFFHKTATYPHGFLDWRFYMIFLYLESNYEEIIDLNFMMCMMFR